MVEKSINTGTAVIVIAGGGHRTLNVGGEAADFVSFFYNYGISTVILRNRLRADGYVAEVDAVHDAQQAVRVVRAYAKELGHRPQKDRRHGLLRRRGARRSGRRSLRRLGQEEHRSVRPVLRASPRAGLRRHHLPRPDARSPAIARRPRSPKTFRQRFSSAVPPATASTPSGLSTITRRCSSPVFPMWRSTSTATAATPATGCRTIPHVRRPDRSQQHPLRHLAVRFIDWARDLGFLQKPGIETKAAKDVAAYRGQPAPSLR